MPPPRSVLVVLRREHQEFSWLRCHTRRCLQLQLPREEACALALRCACGGGGQEGGDAEAARRIPARGVSRASPSPATQFFLFFLFFFVFFFFGALPLPLWRQRFEAKSEHGSQQHRPSIWPATMRVGCGRWWRRCSRRD